MLVTGTDDTLRCDHTKLSLTFAQDNIDFFPPSSCFTTTSPSPSFHHRQMKTFLSLSLFDDNSNYYRWACKLASWVSALYWLHDMPNLSSSGLSPHIVDQPNLISTVISSNIQTFKIRTNEKRLNSPIHVDQPNYITCVFCPPKVAILLSNYKPQEHQINADVV